ncbi:hypothetical protein [Psychrosphaera algicola]|uniref:Cyclic nucleotide-binding domain-containing protein n=1 Tax=Psychrosphaera algicola TaxID=3023714 RepID=A0ABT5FJX5_9GAMM|nr:hypothetical protein [Psychrosphaera sp. G1-22]MDC2891500.1 hypothetical protein [Psychrosphaera sp. G1-22]
MTQENLFNFVMKDNKSSDEEFANNIYFNLVESWKNLKDTISHEEILFLNAQFPRVTIPVAEVFERGASILFYMNVNKVTDDWKIEGSDTDVMCFKLSRAPNGERTDLCGWNVGGSEQLATFISKVNEAAVVALGQDESNVLEEVERELTVLSMVLRPPEHELQFEEGEHLSIFVEGYLSLLLSQPCITIILENGVKSSIYQ